MGKFDFLYLKIRQIEQGFYAISKWYVPKSFPVLLDEVKSQIIEGYKGGRQEEAEIFRFLHAKLVEIDSKDTAKAESGRKVMLGALIYRYHRLKYHYSGPTSLFSNIENCGLYKAVKAILGGDNAQNRLDATTSYVCLSSFRNALAADETYKRLPHYNNENFIPQVEEQITQHKNMIADELPQLKIIQFINSVAEEIKRIHHELLAEINKLNSVEDLKDCTTRLKDIVNTPYIQKIILQIGIQDLKIQLSEVVDTRSTYASLGLLLFVGESFSDYEKINKTVTTCLTESKFTLKTDDKQRSYRAFEKWILQLDKEEIDRLDLNAWDYNFDLMKLRLRGLIIHEAPLSEAMGI